MKGDFTMKKHGGRKLKRQYLYRKSRGLSRFKQQLNHRRQLRLNKKGA
jgi:hypothetical protein